ncbi:GNAT family N-acetyltransferase [Paracraurococcus lichenis]|uniref:GNAT family N-acetyltransferase n=1 Tax=Paracraurococcus lichenis TaxID=3064888 RepID=A0ABT9DSA5_9PROT|nr:GNAT family N-acetyltransferase [Paracraurococcus sp. LOR1-02]MDO9706787.1 GNAT family N-acetyltransferase [Paracraurococcus sp. LOR1-02]
MTAGLALEVTATPSREDRAAVGKGLGAYNRAAYGRLRGAARWILARDAAGTVQGGAKCELAWGWVYVDWLWVAEGLRRQGLGARLLAAAEALAREHGCVGVHLNTWSFQAPDFYRRQGFAEVGRVEDMPPGAVRYWFAKRF